jgi:hypothetical protein
MFNLLRNNTKVAVTTTTADSLLLRLFTNYNSIKQLAALEYNVICAEKAYNNIFISKAYVAAVTSL